MPRKAKQSADAGLPKGFKTAGVEGSFGAVHDFKKQPELQGELVQIGVYHKGKKDENYTLTIKKVDGSLAAVWGAYMLNGLNDKKLIGSEVYIKFTGTQKLSGKREPMKLYTVGTR